MAGSKTSKRRTSGRTASSKKKKKQAAANGFQNDIILLVILAASIILLVSGFGLGGIVGNGISSFFFGIMGVLAYVFPVVFFIGAAFLLSNRTSQLARKKVVASAVFFLVLCGLVQLITEGYISGTTLEDYYRESSQYHTGGGLIGGAICISTTSAFGTVGGCVIIVMVLMVCLVLITQKSFFGFVFREFDRLMLLVKGGRDSYREGRPDREKARELRARAKAQAKQERRAQKVRKLEEAIEAEEQEDRRNAAASRHHERHKDRPGPNTFVVEAPERDQGQLEFSIHRAEPVQTLEDNNEAIGVEAAVEPEAQALPEEKATRQPSKNPKSSKKEIENGIRNIQHEINSKEGEAKKEYQFPPMNLMKKGSGKSQGDSDAHLRKTAQKLQETLRNFGVNVTITNVSCGPTVTRYELSPDQGVKVSKIVGLADDIKLNLAASDVRIEAPIPGKAAVGIEVPNKENSPVMLRDLLQSPEFQNAKSKLSFAAGKDIAGKPVVTDIAKMPHLLIAGATGSGKSVCINTLIMSILYKARPEEVKMIMIDPKVVELSVYNGIPHLFIPVVTDPKKAAGALNWAVSEMTTRYNTFAEYGVRNLEEYNRKVDSMPVSQDETAPEKMPQIIIIVDELADLMMAAPGEVEDAICRLAQLARAAGIHLIIATQRPSVNVITGLIKANMPSRIAFSVSSGVDSRTILDMNGAEKLLGKGDMLFYPQGYQKPARLQGAFVSDEEVSAVVNFLSDKNPAVTYSSQIQQQVDTPVMPGAAAPGDDRDIYFEEAAKLIIEKERASIGMLQRMFKIGFNRAARIMDQLTDAGVVGPEEGTKPRKVLMSKEEFQSYMDGISG